jgi:hypothetical protein
VVNLPPTSKEEFFCIDSFSEHHPTTHPLSGQVRQSSTKSIIKIILSFKYGYLCIRTRPKPPALLFTSLVVVPFRTGTKWPSQGVHKPLIVTVDFTCRIRSTITQRCMRLYRIVEGGLFMVYHFSLTAWSFFLSNVGKPHPSFLFQRFTVFEDEDGVKSPSTTLTTNLAMAK